MAGPEKLPAAMQKGPTLYSGNLAEPHLFVLPPNTAGEAKLKRRSQPQAISQAPPSHQGLPVIAPTLPAPALPVSLPFLLPCVQLPTASYSSSTVPGTSQVMFFNLPLPSAMPPSAQTQTSSQDVPYSTQQYRKRKQEREQTGTVTRKYVRKTDVILCRNVTKRESHHHIFSTLATGTAKSLRLNRMVNGGLCWRNEVIGKKKQEMTTLQLLKIALSARYFCLFYLVNVCFIEQFTSLQQ